MSAVLDLARIRPGFSDPMRQSQAVFRILMETMARPGTVADLGFAPEPPEGLGSAAAAAALTLFDFETKVWLDPALRGCEAQDWIRFHCGCPLTADPAEAAFAVATDARACPPLAAFHQGDAKYPDRSTTLIVEVAALEGGAPVVLTGPGIKTEARIAPAGLPQGFWDQAQANHAQFQFGVDVLFACGDRLIALPRSTAIQIEGS